MSTELNSLTAHALALPPEQRVELAHILWESLEPKIEIDEELIAEIVRRDAEMEAGTVRTYSREEVMRNARKVLGE